MAPSTPLVAKNTRTTISPSSRRNAHGESIHACPLRGNAPAILPLNKPPEQPSPTYAMRHKPFLPTPNNEKPTSPAGNANTASTPSSASSCTPFPPASLYPPSLADFPLLYTFLRVVPTRPLNVRGYIRLRTPVLTQQQRPK